MHFNITGAAPALVAATAIGLSTMANEPDPFIQMMDTTVTYALKETTAIHDDIKSGVLHAWVEVKTNGIYEVTSSDAQVRAPFVHLQMLLEHIFSVELKASIESAVGYIYTPAPSTPLCTEGDITNDLVAPSVSSNPHLLSTVQGRVVSCRNLLAKGAKLYVVYPEGGKSKRSEEQRATYEKLLQTPEFDLVDCEQSCKTMDNDLVGALYLLKAPSGQIYAFAIKMPQANSPQEPTQSGLWFGSAEHPEVKLRIAAVLDAIRRDPATPQQMETFGL